MISPHISDDNSWSNLTLSNASLHTYIHTYIRWVRQQQECQPYTNTNTQSHPVECVISWGKDGEWSSRCKSVDQAGCFDRGQQGRKSENSNHHEQLLGVLSCRGRIFGGINVGDLYGVDSSRFARGSHGIMHISATI